MTPPPEDSRAAAPRRRSGPSRRRRRAEPVRRGRARAGRRRRRGPQPVPDAVPLPRRRRRAGGDARRARRAGGAAPAGRAGAAARAGEAAALGPAGLLRAAGARCPSPPASGTSTPAPPTSTIPRSPSRSAPRRSSAAAAGLLGALTQIGTGTASDPDILFEFIDSQEIVEEIDAEIDLRTIYNRPDGDPVFTLGPDRSIEALLATWQRMVEVSYDSNAGIIHVRANAFTPEDARAIAQAILARSGALVNRLSDQAREDAVRFARAGARRGRGSRARGAPAAGRLPPRPTASSTPRPTPPGRWGS